MTSSDTGVSIVIPVHNGGENFRKCLSSVAACDPPPLETIVVADGESDGSWRIAEEYAMQVIKLPLSGGPARARNAGANAAKGDILFFIDADETVPKDAVKQIAADFRQHPDMAALFGSYDDDPYESNFLSQYKNLLHHYVHQTGSSEASTFWSGCGVIRRNIFLEMNGFDEGYRHPSIEDIELGYRLRKAGHTIRLLKELQVKHLKRWGIRSLLKADFFFRALPWTELILNEGKFVNDLNLKLSGRISVAAVFILMLSLMGAVFIPKLLIPALLSAGLLLWINRDVYRFFQKKRGLCFALKTIPWHWFYFFYSGAAFVIGFARHRLNPPENNQKSGTCFENFPERKDKE